MLKVLVKRLDRWIFAPFINEYQRILEKEVISDCRTLLDVGCGTHSPIIGFAKRLDYSVGIDAFEESIHVSQAKGIHNEYRVMSVLDIAKVFDSRSFDCVLASDVIEHLRKEDGYKLIERMEKIARKKVIVFTPNGFFPQAEYDGNRLQAHLSGWSGDEMRGMGYRVVGIAGWKRVRGMRVLGRLSYLSQPIVRGRPEFAFQMLCVKDIRSEA